MKPEAVQAKYLEVSISEADNTTHLIKKFNRKCRKEEHLKAVYDKRFYVSKSRRRRQKKLKAVYEYSKRGGDLIEE